MSFEIRLTCYTNEVKNRSGISENKYVSVLNETKAKCIPYSFSLWVYKNMFAALGYSSA
jgi:hypothetical protein